MNPLYSAPITLVRYKNGTLLKLMASTYEFVSYDYYNTDGTKKDNPNFSPDAITITARLEGDIQFGKWYYSFDGTNWIDVSTKTYTETRMTISTNMLILEATSPLFAENNSYITIKAESNEPLQADRYYDTVTIARTVDPIVTYSNLSTQIVQTKESIALIASSEQLQHFSEQSTVVTKLTEVEASAGAFESLVRSTYATKTYAGSQASSALNAAKGYTDRSLTNYVDNATLETRISQTESSITESVSSTYATQASVAQAFTGDTVHYVASSHSSGVTKADPDTDEHWGTDPQAVTATKKYLWIYHTYTHANSPDTDTTPYIAGVYGDKGQTGDAGINTATITLYKRGGTAPGKPTATITYNFKNNSFSGDLGGWSPIIPSGADPCWAIVAVASGNGDSDTISSSEWSTQAKILENGGDGTPGLNQATITLYRRAESQPQKPTGGQIYTFSTGTLNSVPSGWSTSVPSGDNPCYVTSAAAISDQATYTITAWNDVTLLVQNGATGSRGPQGPQGSAGVGVQEVVPLYYASSQMAPPSKPQAYVNNTNVDYNVWTRAIPPIVGDYNYLFTCDQVTDTNGDTTWTTVVTDAAVVSMSTRLSAAELKITDEAIISTVKKEYGEVSDEGKNLLVDTNAPTLTPVDDPDIRRTLSSSWDTQSTQSTLDRSWGTIPTTLKNIPAGVEYGVFISSRNSRFIQHTHADDVSIQWESDTKSVIDFRGSAIYTISVYAAIGNKDADQLNNRESFPKINVFIDGYTSGGTKTNITSFSWVFPESAKAGEVVKLAYTVHMPASASNYNKKYLYFRTDIQKDLIDIYLMGFKVENGYQATDWNDGTPALATNTSVESQIYQSADEIRMKATTLVWESQNSSMDASGNMTIGAARINNSWSGVTNGDGMIVGRGQITAMKDGDSEFDIRMPYADDIKVTEYTNVDEGEPVIITDDEGLPEVPATIKHFILGQDTPPYSPSYERPVVNITASNYGIRIGAGGNSILTMADDGKLFIDTDHLYINGVPAYSGIVYLPDRYQTGLVEEWVVYNGLLICTVEDWDDNHYGPYLPS